jgi:hypothetical protein
MKTIVKLIIFLGLSFQINAQDIRRKIFNNKYQSVFSFNSSVRLFKSFDFLMIPQFGGLFNESFKNVEGITNLKNYYDDFDLGLKLGFNYKIKDKMTFTSVYNIGMLKFNLTEASNIQGAIIKVVFCYNF